MVVGIVGGGLAGICAAYTALKSGANVILFDKTKKLGGNAMKASSGISAAPTAQQAASGIQDDTRALFERDIIASAKGKGDTELIHRLATESSDAVAWLTSEFGLDLNTVTVLGGHSRPRTHRNIQNTPGYHITSTIMAALRERFPEGQLRIENEARVTRLEIVSDGDVCIVLESGEAYTVKAVVVATGGYAADLQYHSATGQGRASPATPLPSTHSTPPSTTAQSSVIPENSWTSADGTPNASLLSDFLRSSDQSPALRKAPIATTSGPHCTGDGIRMLRDIGASVMGLDLVQMHPTGIVDPQHPDSPFCVLAAEALRGAGGVLLNSRGQRFTNELATRDAVTRAILSDSESGPHYLVIPTFASGAVQAYFKFYGSRGLAWSCDSTESFADTVGMDKATVAETIATYSAAAAGRLDDPFGRSKFAFEQEWTMEAGVNAVRIQPVLHYSMGGIAATADAQVVRPNGEVLGRVYCAGEVMGNLHGANRLGGCSLLDCVVFGRIAGKQAAQHQ